MRSARGTGGGARSAGAGPGGVVQLWQWNGFWTTYHPVSYRNIFCGANISCKKYLRPRNWCSVFALGVSAARLLTVSTAGYLEAAAGLAPASPAAPGGSACSRGSSAPPGPRQCLHSAHARTSHTGDDWQVPTGSQTVLPRVLSGDWQIPQPNVRHDVRGLCNRKT